MSLYPTPTTYEFMDEFRDSPFYKEAQDYSGMSTMDQRYNPFTGSYGGSSDFNRYKHAYDKFLTERSKPADFDESQALPNFQPITMKPGPSNQNPFGGLRNDLRRSPFMGGFGGFGRSPFMGGFGRSPFMGGFGSPFGGLGMFGMSPYGGYGGYGMFGGMMNPFMGMGGFGQMQPYRGNLPFERRMRFPQQPQQPQGPSTNFGTDSGTGLSPPSTQQSTQGGNYMGPNVNNFMQNPFMAGLGSMMGNMFSGGYGSNVSNTQANVAQ